MSVQITSDDVYHILCIYHIKHGSYLILRDIDSCCRLDTRSYLDEKLLYLSKLPTNWSVGRCFSESAILNVFTKLPCFVVSCSVAVVNGT